MYIDNRKLKNWGDCHTRGIGGFVYTHKPFFWFICYIGTLEVYNEENQAND